jgi:multidrug transporter EmrE-like cation transporter
MYKFVLVFLGIFASAMAQIMLKKSTEFAFLKELDFFKFFILGGLFYVFSFGIYAYALKIFSLSKISPVMTIGTMLLVVLAGVIFFRESLAPRQIVGIFLGITAVLLIMK